MEFDNHNYLLTTTPCTFDKTTKKKAVSAYDIQHDMENSGCSLPVLIFDCCREFKGMRSSTRSISRGLGKMEPHGSYLVFSCAPLQSAEDWREDRRGNKSRMRRRGRG